MERLQRLLSRARLALAFAPVLFLLSCKSSSPAPPDGDIAVPKMPTDASMGGAANGGPAADPAVVVKATGASHGWHFANEELQPKYVPSAELATELQGAAKRGDLVVAVIDETIEECSSAGGSHVLFKTELGLVHFGGHGVYLQPFPSKGESVVVAIERLAAPESIEKKTFCVPARSIVARAKVVLPIARVDDGERMIADLKK